MLLYKCKFYSVNVKFIKSGGDFGYYKGKGRRG